MSAKQITYWACTGLIAFLIGTGGVSQVFFQYAKHPHGTVPELDYPMYFFLILGIWKVLGAVTIVVPGWPRLKEWAYAGIFFDLSGAAASCLLVHSPAFHLVAPLVLIVPLMASWWLRPRGRMLGALGTSA